MLCFLSLNYPPCKAHPGNRFSNQMRIASFPFPILIENSSKFPCFRTIRWNNLEKGNKILWNAILNLPNEDRLEKYGIFQEDKDLYTPTPGYE